jgi:nicotinate phosphoribosyltransferase
MSKALLTDLYELTMGQAYFDADTHEDIAYFDVFFRKIPDAGGYAVAAGLPKIIEFVQNYSFTSADIDYLKNLSKFTPKYLSYLSDMKISCDIWSVPEGTVVFAGEPLMTVRGPLLQVQLLESAILMYFNHATLIATKSSRMSHAAKDKGIIELGMRNAHGEASAVNGALYAYIGGGVGTSCVSAGAQHGIPVVGTMAHSFVQAFPTEHDAFTAYAKSYPNDCVLLVDTVDTLRSGVPNAIRVHKEILAPLGKSLKAIRLDSGDLAYLSKEARKMLNAAGLKSTQIYASNALDEHIIESLIAQNAPIDVFGVGAQLITSKSSATLGGVYKLVAIEQKGVVIPKIKVSDNADKTTDPGFKKTYRFIDKKTGYMIADLVAFADEIIDTKSYQLIDHSAPWNTKTLTNYTLKELMVPIFKSGELVYAVPTVQQTKQYATQQKNQLWEELKRLKNPHKYIVDLSAKLRQLKLTMLQKSSLSAKRELLVIIDMVNGFVKYGALHDKDIGNITPSIIKLVEQFKNNNQQVISFQDTHDPDDEEFKTFPPHCIEGTGECDLVDELSAYEKHIMVFGKKTTNGMDNPAIKQFFERNKFDEITLTGCCTDICVQQFALALIDFLKQANIKSKVIVPADCVATFNSPEHNAAMCHKKALEIMKKAGVIIK